MRGPLIVALASLLGCEAEITVEDGSSAAGASSSWSSGTGASSSGTGASSAEGGAPPAPGFDAIGKCEETCNRPCVGTPSTCIEACLDTIEPNCEAEAFLLHECSMWYCAPECDWDQAEQVLLDCMNPFFCGHAGNEYECDYETAGVCDCTGACDDGHTGRIVCSNDETCDCYFDGELVASCSEDTPSASCDFQQSCCVGFMLPGGGPAASGE
jgi:hypothetical protein